MATVVILPAVMYPVEMTSGVATQRPAAGGTGGVIRREVSRWCCLACLCGSLVACRVLREDVSGGDLAMQAPSPSSIAAPKPADARLDEPERSAAPSLDEGSEASEKVEAQLPEKTPPVVEPVPAEEPSTSSGALSLWVLNRNQEDLEAAPEPAPPSVPDSAPVAAAAPPSSLLAVALGTISGRPCAQSLVDRGMSELYAGRSLERVAVQVLSEASRLRWPASRVQLALLDSEGHFGAVHESPAALGAGLLDRAWKSGTVVNARRRSRVTTPGRAELDDPAQALGGCAEPLAIGDGSSMRGSLSVVGRHGGRLLVGVAQQAPDADAGVVPFGAQYGVAVAAGKGGVVGVLSDCDPLPSASRADAAYESLVGGSFPRPRSFDDCSVGYAWLTPSAVDVVVAEATAGLVWARATREPPDPGGAAPEPSAPGAPENVKPEAPSETPTIAPVTTESAAPEATAPEATAPEATAPEAMAPEAMAPEAMAPEAMAPEAMAPEAMTIDAGLDSGARSP